MSEVNVIISDHDFSPRSITVAVGDMVTWINKGQVEHYVVGDWGGYYPVQPGGWASLTIIESMAGQTYWYKDENRPSMTGYIVVSGE